MNICIFRGFSKHIKFGGEFGYQRTVVPIICSGSFMCEPHDLRTYDCSNISTSTVINAVIRPNSSLGRPAWSVYRPVRPAAVLRRQINSDS